MAIPPPAPSAIGTLLEGLLGREVRAVKASAPVAAPATLALYATPQGEVVGAWGWDLPGAAAAAAALSLVPVAVVNAAVTAKELPPLLTENLHEVMNVGARLFSGGGRASLTDVHQGATAVAALKALMAATRVDFEVRIAGYAQGRMFLAFVRGEW